MSGINIVGTGGIIEGTTNDVDVNVNLDTSLSFDGSDDVIDIGDITVLDGDGSFTQTAWVKFASDGGSEQYIAWKDDAFGIGLFSNFRIRGYIYYSGGNTNTQYEFPDTTNGPKGDGWIHVASSYDSSNLKLYINGDLKHTVALASKTIANSSNNFKIGGISSGTQLKGEIADVRLYSSTLTDAEIKTLASKINIANEAVQSTSTLVGWWKLNNNSITDSSANSNNGTATGTTQVYDDYSVDILNNNAGGSGTFKVTQGKVEGKALTSVDFEDTQDYGKIAFASTITQSHDNMSIACWIKKENATGNDDTILGKSDLPHHHYLKIGTNGKIIYKQYPQTLDTSGDPVNDTEWHHIVVTLNGDNNGAIYLDGRAQTLGNNSVIADGTFDQIGLRGDSGDGEATANEMDGLIRDVRFYDFALSAEQAASLCANTLPITPKHHYKLDEGSGGNGDTVADTGTGTTNNGTLGPAGHAPNWSNGTLTLDGTLTIGESNDSSVEATISAPRGILHLTADLQSFGAITHNNGTFKLDNGSSMHTYNALGGANQRELTFYNVTMEGTGGDGYRIAGSITIEKDWLINNTRTSVSNNAGGGHNSGVVVTLGTTTSAGSVTINSGKELETYTYANSHSVTYQGVSPLYPALFTNNGTFEETLGSLLETVPEVKFSNLKFALPFATRPDDGDGSGGSKITLIGDCEFDDLTLTLGDDELHTDGHRLQAVDFTVQSTSTLDWEDSLCVFSGHVDLNGNITTANSDTKIIHNTSAEKNWRSLYADAGVFFANGTQTTMTGYNWTSTGNEPIEVIAGSIFNTNSLKMNSTNLAIPQGGNFSGSTNTHSIAGDWTFSGGLLGTSCLSLDRDNTEYAQVPYHADLNLFNTRNAMTAECWFKTSYNGSNHQHIINLMDIDANPQVMQMYIDYSTGKINARIFTSGITSSQIGASDVRDGKWHHVAIVFDGGTGEHSLYVDGKLEATETGSGAVYPATDAEFNIGVRYSLDQGYFEGEIDEVRLFAAAKTAAQIRIDMFKDVGTSLTYFNTPADASTDGVVGRWGANEGTGSTLACSNSNLNGVIYDYNGGSPAAYTDAWAAAGTYTRGTSTVDMTGNGTINITGGVTAFNNLKVAASTKTTTLSVLGGSSDIRFHGTLTHGGGTANSSGNPAWTMKGTSTVSAGSDWTGWYLCYWESSTAVPTASWKYWLALTDSTLAGDMTCTGYFRPHQSVVTFAGNTVTTNDAIFHSTGGVNMGSGSLIFTQANGLSSTQSDSVFTGGPGATVTGVAAKSTFMSQNNFVLVGKAENLNVTNEELSVTGQVINCTGEIHQQFPTIDHDQQLDFDTADDRDIILGRDLDKNTELINS